MSNPMLAGKAPSDLSKVNYPVLASVKLDGVRILVRGGVALSRSLKPLPNRFVQQRFGRPEYEGLDGELIVGPSNHPDVRRTTTSGVMSKDGEPDATLFAFDVWDRPSLGFAERLALVERRVYTGLDGERVPYTMYVNHDLIVSQQSLEDYEEAALNAGYEGVMLRAPNGPYKYGRSTTKEGSLLKLKRFEDSEAEVLGVVELMHNTNEAFVDERGHTKRSTAAEGLVGSGVMGMLEVRDIHTGVEFGIGSGFTAAERAKFFTDPPKYVKYKHFPKGVKDKPLLPVYLGVWYKDEA